MDLPYQVENQKFDIGPRPDGTFGGVWTVHIRHRDGIQSSFTVPEENYTAKVVHGLAMDQVHAAEAVAKLPQVVEDSK